MSLLYLVSRCRKDDSIYGPIHGAFDAKKTLCGKDIDWRWRILNVLKDSGREVTCKGCLNKLECEEGRNQDDV